MKIIDRFPGLLPGIRSITKKNMIGRKNDIKTNDIKIKAIWVKIESIIIALFVLEYAYYLFMMFDPIFLVK